MDLGFSYRVLPSSEIAIDRGGKTVTTLRGDAARRFAESVASASFDEAQGTMARVTGNYRRGNERMGKDHPRNR